MRCFPVDLGFPPPSSADELFSVRRQISIVFNSLHFETVVGVLSSYISHLRLSLFKNSISLYRENVGLEPYTVSNLLFHKMFWPCLESGLIKTIPVIPTTYFMFALSRSTLHHNEGDHWASPKVQGGGLLNFL